MKISKVSFHLKILNDCSLYYLKTENEKIEKKFSINVDFGIFMRIFKVLETKDSP